MRAYGKLKTDDKRGMLFGHIDSVLTFCFLFLIQIDETVLACLPPDILMQVFTVLHLGHCHLIISLFFFSPSGDLLFAFPHFYEQPSKRSPGKSLTKSPKKSPKRKGKTSPVFKVPKGRAPVRKSLRPKSLEFLEQVQQSEQQVSSCQRVQWSRSTPLVQEPSVWAILWEIQGLIC